MDLPHSSLFLWSLLTASRPKREKFLLVTLYSRVYSSALDTKSLSRGPVVLQYNTDIVRSLLTSLTFTVVEGIVDRDGGKMATMSIFTVEEFFFLNSEVYCLMDSHCVLKAVASIFLPRNLCRRHRRRLRLWGR